MTLMIVRERTREGCFTVADFARIEWLYPKRKFKLVSYSYLFMDYNSLTCLLFLVAFHHSHLPLALALQ